jgi:tripartite-type tricarboxylate transporter receptor subunit TctC
VREIARTIKSSSEGGYNTGSSSRRRSVHDASAAANELGNAELQLSGSGGANHLSGELFKSMARIQIVHVPYRGNAPSMTALVSGEVDFAFNSMPSSLPLIKAGRLRPIAVTSSHRSTALPQVPTVAEAGLPG